MPEYIQRSLRRITGTRQATIDTIEPGAIAVSPRRPIDRFDVAAITEVLDLATKIGAVLLDSGTAASDTQAQVEFIAGAYGLDDVDVDVTYNKIMASARRGATLPPITTMAQVKYRSLDFTRLADVDRLIRHIRNSGITPSTAHRIVDKIIAAPHPYPHRVSTVAWGVMSAGVSLLLGGGLLVAVVTFLTTVVIVSVNRRINRLGTPVFFQQVIGGFIAPAPPSLLPAGSRPPRFPLTPPQGIPPGPLVPPP
ncbi:threonine/serine exporter ThrE family protein, partial [uncultured Gordonia sp.]|uniref:threonine/serine ThrE exporter family protein n=1 Tax=uncultured Gordonia sp. TaxID=198437 RepID=UPI00260258EF